VGDVCSATLHHSTAPTDGPVRHTPQSPRACRSVTLGRILGCSPAESPRSPHHFASATQPSTPSSGSAWPGNHNRRTVGSRLHGDTHLHEHARWIRQGVWTAHVPRQATPSQTRRHETRVRSVVPLCEVLPHTTESVGRSVRRVWHLTHEGRRACRCGCGHRRASVVVNRTGGSVRIPNSGRTDSPKPRSHHIRLESVGTHIRTAIHSLHHRISLPMIVRGTNRAEVGHVVWVVDRLGRSGPPPSRLTRTDSHAVLRLTR
jgi:hypothetical protein